MATDGGDTEATDPADVPLTEEDVLAFFHSKSGEVRNSELVSHFRRALKTGQHRATNRQHFPRFVNSLATVRHDDSGRKILTLKKKFRRQEDADVVADRGTASTNVAEAAKCTSLDNDNNNEEETSSKAREAEIGPDDGNRNGNGEREQSAVEEVSASKNDNGEREEEIPASTGQEAAEREDTPAGSGVEKAQPASVSENDVDDDGVGVPETSSAEDGKKSSLDNGDVEETQQANDRTETDVFDNAGGVESLKTELEETGENPSVEIVVEDYSQTAGGQLGDAADGLQDIRRVRQLARRIDDSVTMRTSTTPATTSTAQVRCEPGRPSSDRRRLTTTATPYDFSMNESQRDWTLNASYSDYQALAKLLSRFPGLAGRRDFITGYSALHWAAKNGRADVVKLLMGCPEAPDVDSRSHGGYTGLHVAAMNSRHDVIELLVVVYKADPDIADFSGRKPIYYLAHDSAAPGRRSSALLRSEMLLAPRRGATTSTPRKRPVQPRRQPSNVDDDDDDDSDSRPAAIQSLLSLTRNVATLMLPPRDLPAVLRRRPVTARLPSDSHSDSESTGGVAPSRHSMMGLRPTGSTSDIVGTVV